MQIMSDPALNKITNNTLQPWCHNLATAACQQACRLDERGAPGELMERGGCQPPWRQTKWKGVQHWDAGTDGFDMVDL